ncbi:MAG: nickel-binding protein [Solirubrobacterales bacterium]
MDMFMIRRREAWKTPAELEAAAARSTAVADEEFPGSISWIRSYVVEELNGDLGTVCIYQASDVEAVRDHAAKVGMPADEVLTVADTVVVRPDPKPEAA